MHADSGGGPLEASPSAWPSPVTSHEKVPKKKVKATAVSKASAFFAFFLFFGAFFCACHVCQSAMADVGWSAPILSVSFPECRAVTEVTHSGPQLKMLSAPVGK